MSENKEKGDKLETKVNEPITENTSVDEKIKKEKAEKTNVEEKAKNSESKTNKRLILPITIILLLIFVLVFSVIFALINITKIEILVNIFGLTIIGLLYIITEVRR